MSFSTHCDCADIPVTSGGKDGPACGCFGWDETPSLSHGEKHQGKGAGDTGHCLRGGDMESHHGASKMRARACRDVAGGTMWGDTGDEEGTPVWGWDSDTSRWGHRAGPHATTRWSCVTGDVSGDKELVLDDLEMVLGGQDMASDVWEVVLEGQATVLVDQEVVLGTRI